MTDIKFKLLHGTGQEAPDEEVKVLMKSDEEVKVMMKSADIAAKSKEIEEVVRLAEEISKPKDYSVSTDT
ncbi:MAG: hypothetical protein ACR2P9_05510 [Gammaproteobacteria bacterium]